MHIWHWIPYFSCCISFFLSIWTLLSNLHQLNNYITDACSDWWGPDVRFLKDTRFIFLHFSVSFFFFFFFFKLSLYLANWNPFLTTNLTGIKYLKTTNHFPLAYFILSYKFPIWLIGIKVPSVMRKSQHLAPYQWNRL